MSEDFRWFEGPAGPLLGCLHVPDDGRARVGVVLCPPVGVELLAAHSGLRHLGRSLARAGIVALRFDYDGTGDSSGALLRGGVAGWTASIAAAADELRRTGVDTVVLLGLRLGATLVSGVVALRSDIAGVVLWDPCQSGRAFLREQQALLRLSSYRQRDPAPGVIETPGFAFGTAAAADIQRLQLLPLRTTAPVLALVRDTGADWLRALGRDSGQPVDVLHAPRQAEILAEGRSEDRLADASAQRIVEWVERLSDAPRRQLGRPAPVTRAVVAVGDRGPIEEEIVWFPPGNLFAIRTTPLLASGTTVVFFNTGDQHHIGPSRAWVDYSRELAAHGVTCVRVDLSGLGESDPREGWPDNTVAAPTAIDDAVGVLRALQMESGDILPVGLCSGASPAAEAAVALRLGRLLTINPTFASTPAEQGRDRRRQLSYPRRPWFVSARTHAGRMTRRISSTFSVGTLELEHLPRTVSWLLDALHLQPSPSRALLTLSDAVGRSLVVCGSLEERTLRSGTPLRLRRAERLGRIRLQVVEDLDHALWDLASRAAVKRILLDELVNGGAVTPVESPSRGARDAASAVSEHSRHRRRRTSA